MVGKDAESDGKVGGHEMSRRKMGAMSVAAGVVAATGSAAVAAELTVKETDVEVKTPDGVCDAAFIHPTSGTHPGVIIWTDAFGLRPSFREMGKRLAAQGYTVLVPNPYYRTGKAPLGAGLNFNNPDDRTKLQQLMGSLSDSASVMRDATAYVTFLDSQKATKKSAKIGANGYCMGGRLTMLTAAAVPERVGAGGSFHGGGLVTDKPDSPHLLVPKMKASFYFGIAASDDKTQPDAKDKLKVAFDAAKLPAEIEVYDGANHGWCVPDMPARPDGGPVYDQAKAEVAWGHLLTLYKTALV